MVAWRQLLLLLMMLLCSEAAVFGACEGLTGKPAAQCLLGNIESEGHLSPEAFGGNQSLVPQYQGTPGCAEGGCSGIEVPGESGPELEEQGRSQLGGDEQAQQVLEMQRNQSNVDVTNTPPIVTAGEVARNTSFPPQTVETCTNIEICLEQKKLPRTFTCVDCTPFVDLGCTETGPTCVTEVNGVCTQMATAIACPLDPACTRMGVVKQCMSCGTPGSLVPFCTDLSTPPNEHFNEHATYLEVVEQAKEDWDPNTLVLFQGEKLGCKQSLIIKPIVDCCDEDPSKLFGSCSNEEIRLAANKQAGLVHFVGTHCTDELDFGFGSICLEEEQVFCSFKSKLTRIIHEQGRPQVGRGWGSGENPDCSGFHITQFRQLDFALMDLSEWYPDIEYALNVEQTIANSQTNLCLALGTCGPGTESGGDGG
ncbi:MAG: hypothetical protein NPIRA02_01180 [Nitrospirales bacterium]|nr:MAG: hypothetical protein NPIRA02_01180 [Nitrospirales bacterium]